MEETKGGSMDKVPETDLERVGQLVREKLVASNDPEIADDLKAGGAILALRNLGSNKSHVAGRPVVGMSDEFFDGNVPARNQAERAAMIREERDARMTRRKREKR